MERKEAGQVFEVRLVGHHTCSNNGGRDFVEANAPFLAEFSEETGKFQFLGSGYYFWDDNLEMAREWGKMHYKSSFFVLKALMTVQDTHILDLVGNRQTCSISWTSPGCLRKSGT